MIASPDVLYDTRKELFPQPMMVREPVAAPSNAASLGSRPKPGREDDDLARLGERIAELAARINVAESQMMTLIADFDRRGGWKDGFGSCAEWLAWRTGIKIGPARERVRTARALEKLPQTAGALREGSISYAKVRALTRVATPECEAELLEFARAGSAAKLERTVRMWKKLSRDEELTAEEARHRSRAFSVFVDGDGMYVVKGRLEPEAGAVLMRAIEAASDALFRREGRASAGSHEGNDGASRPEPKQRRADAVGLLAERALAAGFGGGECQESDGDVDAMGSDVDEPDGAQTTESNAALRGEPVGTPGAEPQNAANAQPRIESGTRAERYQVMVHCDAAVVAMVHAKDGSVLNVGRRTRTIPPHIRRALEERDRGCRFPGCGCRFTEAHHVKHWADGGETSVRNTLLLCRRHHRAVHEGRVKVSVNRDGTVLFFTPRGRMLADAPNRPTSANARGQRVSEEASSPRVCDEARASDQGVSQDLPPVPSVHPAALSMGKAVALSNGAALYPDSAIPWEIEAEAREAVEESLD